MNKLTFEFKQGDYIDCSELSKEQVQMILDRMWGCGANKRDDIEDYTKYFCKLTWDLEDNIYFISYPFPIFSDDMRDEVSNCRNLTWEDITKESNEEGGCTTPSPTPPRVKTIDIERKTYEYIFTEQSLEDYITVEKIVGIKTRISHDFDKLVSSGGLACDKSTFKIVYTGGKLIAAVQAYVESEEAHKARIQREKELNDMYNHRINELVQENMNLKAQLKGKV